MTTIRPRITYNYIQGNPMVVHGYTVLSQGTYSTRSTRSGKPSLVQKLVHSLRGEAYVIADKKILSPLLEFATKFIPQSAFHNVRIK